MLLTTLAIWLKIPVVHVKFDTKNNLKENSKPQTQRQETLYLPAYSPFGKLDFLHGAMTLAQMLIRDD